MGPSFRFRFCLQLNRNVSGFIRVGTVAVLALAMFGVCPTVQSSPDGGTWVSVGPWGGHISQLVSPAGHPEIVYAGTSNGVFRSEDGGEHWAAVNNGLDNRSVYSLAINPADPNILYCACGWYGMLYRTTDGGAQWALANTGLPADAEVHAIAIDPNTPSTLYAGAFTDGLYKSTDGGTTWAPSTTGLTASLSAILVLNPSDPQTLYTDGPHGLYISTNGASTWSLLYPTDDTLNSLAIDPSDPIHLYLATANTGLLQSTDGGATWNPGGPPPRSLSVIAVDPTSPGTLYLGGDRTGIYQSTDHGAHWASLGAALSDETISVVLVQAGAGNLLVGTGQAGVYRITGSGETWTESNAGIGNMEARAVTADPNHPGTLYVGLNGRGVFKTTDWGATWQELNHGLDPNYVYVKQIAINPQDSDVLYLGLDGGGVYRSTDGGQNWSLTEAGPTLVEIQFVVIDPQTPSTLYTSEYDNGLYKSMDSGLTWQTTGRTGKSTWSLALDPADPQVLYAGGDDGVSKSSDGGATWMLANQGLNGMTAQDLIVDPQTPSRLYATVTDMGVVQSTDSGASWTTAMEGLPTNIVTHLALNAQQHILYASAFLNNYNANDSLFRSLDDGAHWTQFADGIDVFGIDTIMVDPTISSRVYVATDAGGLFALGNPSPTITRVGYTLVGGPQVGASLTVAGTGFFPDSLVYCNGSAVDTTYLSGQRLRAMAPADLLNGASLASVSVTNPYPGGGASPDVELSLDLAGDQPPLTTPDQFTVKPGTSSLEVLANDSDPDQDDLYIESLSSPSHGQAALGSGLKTILYTPEPGYLGPDSFHYSVSDGKGASNGATVTLQVNPLDPLRVWVPLVAR
jgi:photosystem II stability/assembly factor-like uncharacterized protein